MEYSIFFASDDNYSMHLTVAITSILINSKIGEFFNFYVLDGGIKNKNKEKITNLKKIKNFNLEFIQIKNEKIDKCPMAGLENVFSRQAYYRYLIPFIKPNLDKALYLDCDVAVNSSLLELYQTDLKNAFCAVCKEENNSYLEINCKNTEVKNYFNSGVMLINCKKWREENIFEKLIENTDFLFKENRLKFLDQDALNYTFRENVIFIDLKFNFQSNNMKAKKPKTLPAIIHYSSRRKPWKKGYEFFPECYLKPLYIAGFKKEFYKIKLNHFIWKFINSIFNVKNFYKENKKHKLITILGFDYIVPCKK